MLIMLRLAGRKDARSFEKPFKCHLIPPFFEYNLWMPLAIACFILVGAEVGRHSNSNIDFVYLFLTFLLNAARPTK
jgi:hypothetical protein